MTRLAATPCLDMYGPALRKWMPYAEIRTTGRALALFDGVVTWKAARGVTRYLVEEKRHLRHQDVGIVVEQLHRRRATLPPGRAEDRVLLLAPHVRRQQAAEHRSSVTAAGHPDGRRPQGIAAVVPSGMCRQWTQPRRQPTLAALSSRAFAYAL